MNPPSAGKFYGWKPGACLKVSGADAATFLQGQFTNDLQHAVKDRAVYGLWLNQKGKVLADSFIVAMGPNDYRIVSYFSSADVIRARLEAYIIADDVVVEDLTSELQGVTYFGRAEDFGTLSDGALIFSGRRNRDLHHEVIFSEDIAAQIRAKFSTKEELSAQAIERLRIHAVIPAVPADIGPTDLPNEGRLEQDAISYTKGCYLGQEVMARLKSMGQVRRQLRLLRGNGGVPILPAPLFQESRKVGELRSAVAEPSGWSGLALLSTLQFKTGPTVALSADGLADIVVEGGS
jgi:folate-binding protein YgfZ